MPGAIRNREAGASEPVNSIVDEKLEQIFRAVFALPASAPVRDLEQPGVPMWDSLGHVSLVAALESEFDTSIDVDEALRMTSYATVRGLLAEKGL